MAQWHTTLIGYGTLSGWAVMSRQKSHPKARHAPLPPPPPSPRSPNSHLPHHDHHHRPVLGARHAHGKRSSVPRPPADLSTLVSLQPNPQKNPPGDTSVQYPKKSRHQEKQKPQLQHQLVYSSGHGFPAAALATHHQQPLRSCRKAAAWWLRVTFSSATTHHTPKLASPMITVRTIAP